MIEHVDVEQFASFDDLVGDQHILGARHKVARKIVMRHNQGGTVPGQGRFEDLAHPIVDPRICTVSTPAFGSIAI